jgi:hypothetical protein
MTLGAVCITAKLIGLFQLYRSKAAYRSSGHMSAFAGSGHGASLAIGGNGPLADLRSAANIGSSANHRSLQPSL